MSWNWWLVKWCISPKSCFPKWVFQSCPSVSLIQWTPNMNSRRRNKKQKLNSETTEPTIEPITRKETKRMKLWKTSLLKYGRKKEGFEFSVKTRTRHCLRTQVSSISWCKLLQRWSHAEVSINQPLPPPVLPPSEKRKKTTTMTKTKKKHIPGQI